MNEVMTENVVPEISLGMCRQLSLRATFADIQILPVEPGGRPRITAANGYQLDPEAIQVQSEGERSSVVVSNSLGSWWRSIWEKRSGRSLILYVPQDVDAEISTSAGRVRVSHLSNCKLLISNEAGATKLHHVHGQLRLSSEAGEIRGEDVGGSFDIAASAGEVRLSISSIDPGEHHMEASMGAIKLHLARGLAASFEAKAPLGAVKIKYPSTPNAPAHFLLRADLGEIKVLEDQRWARQGGTVVDLGDPYRSPEAAPRPMSPSAPVIEDETLDRILAKVADGSLSPQAAADLIKALRAPHFFEPNRR